MWDKEIAKLFMDKDKIKGYGPIIGKVISGPPNIKVSALSGKIILDKNYLYINDFLLSNYQRNIIIDGEIEFIEEDLEIDTEYEAQGIISFVDTLKENDEVLLLPTESGQKFFLVCKVKQLE